MQKIGYIFGDVSVSSVEWMNEYGCSAIYKESRACYMIRSKWKGMLRKLSDGDELVVFQLEADILYNFFLGGFFVRYLKGDNLKFQHIVSSYVNTEALQHGWIVTLKLQYNTNWKKAILFFAEKL